MVPQALAAVNSALDGLEYVGAAEWRGDDVKAIAVSDLGNTGAGDALTAEAEVVLAVRTADGVCTRARSTKTLSALVNAPVGYETRRWRACR